MGTCDFPAFAMTTPFGNFVRILSTSCTVDITLEIQPPDPLVFAILLFIFHPHPHRELFTGGPKRSPCILISPSIMHIILMTSSRSLFQSCLVALNAYHPKLLLRLFSSPI